jgi:transposase
MTVTKTPIVETFDPPRSGQRRRFTTEQKQTLSLLEQAKAPDSSISAVARRYGISPSLVFRWKHMQDEGALAGLEADERVVAETEVKDLRAKVRELERLLGKKTMEAEILKEGIELARGKGLLLPRSSSGKGGSR